MKLKIETSTSKKLFKHLIAGLMIIALFSLGCGPPKIRHNLKNTRQIKKVAIVKYSCLAWGMSKDTEEWKFFKQLSMLLLKSTQPAIEENLRRQFNWQVVPVNTAFGSLALDRFGKKYEEFMQKKHSILYKMYKKQSGRPAVGIQPPVSTRYPEVKALVGQLCKALGVDAVVFATLSLSHSTQVIVVVGKSWPCAWSSFGVYDKTGALVLHSSADNSGKAVCSKKSYPMDKIFGGYRINITEKMVGDFAVQSLKAIPEMFDRAKRSYNTYWREQAEKAKKR